LTYEAYIKFVVFKKHITLSTYTYIFQIIIPCCAYTQVKTLFATGIVTIQYSSLASCVYSFLVAKQRTTQQ